LGRRRSEIRQLINRILYTGWSVRVYYVDRDPVRGERLAVLPLERVSRVTGWAVVLDDETVIPLHRIVEVRDLEGRIVWSRRR